MPDLIDLKRDIEEAIGWLPIVDWLGYEVSDRGCIRSYWKMGRYKRLDTIPRIIKPHTKKTGHQSVTLYGPDSCHRDFLIHRLVLEIFIGPCPAGMVACHNNGNPTDNRLCNLRWDTPSGNNRDALKHGTHKNAVLTVSSIPEIWRRLVSGESCASIARGFRVGPGAIRSVKVGRTWSHITRHRPGWPLGEARFLTNPSVHVPVELAQAEEELWRTIPDRPAYRVSNRGRVQSRWTRGGDCRSHLSKRWKDMKPILLPNGYHRVALYDGEGKAAYCYIHNLVLTVFAGPRPHRAMVTCHNDGDRLNNNACNLRWDTPKANQADIKQHHRAKTERTYTEAV